MKKHEEFVQGEELSRCLDELNAGKCPVIDDQEIEELIKMATLVKESQGQQELPRVIIDKIVDDLATELGNKKYKKNTHWLYGGVACAAATVVLALGVQFLVPPATDKNIAQEMTGNLVEEKVVALADSVSKNATPTEKNTSQQGATTSQASVPNSTETLPTVPVEKTEPPVATSITQVMAEIVKVAQVTKEGTTTQVAVLEQDSSEKALEKNPVMMRMGMSSPQVSAQREEGASSNKAFALYAGVDQTIPSAKKDKKMDNQENTRVEYRAFADSQLQGVASPQNVIIMVNGKKINYNSRQPYIKDNGTIMIPLVIVAEPLGYQVKWNQQTKIVELKRSSQWITAKIGEDAYTNGKMSPLSLGDCTEIMEDTIYVPLAFFQVILAMNIFQDENGTIKINELVH